MAEPHNAPTIRTERQTIEAQMMAGTYSTPVDDTEATNPTREGRFFSAQEEPNE